MDDLVSEEGWTFDYGVTTDAGLQAAGITGGIPVTLFFNSDGMLVNRHKGKLTTEEFEAEVQKIM